MNSIFKGIIPPVTTPFAEDGRILYDSLARNMERYAKTDLSGFLLLGSNGEAVHLTEAERLEVVQRASEAIPPDRKIIVGVGGASLAEARRMIDGLAGVRVDALLVAVPSYYKNRMNRAALTRYFVAIAESAPFPTLLYNVPQYSGLELPPVLVGELAQHARIIGMKDSSGNISYVQHVLQRTETERFQLIMGSAQALGPSLTLGVEAAILAVACAYPELPIELLRTFARGGEIAGEAKRLFQVSNAVTSLYGVAGLKHAMDRAGYEGGFCRLPLLPLDAAERAEVDRLLNLSPVAAG